MDSRFFIWDNPKHAIFCLVAILMGIGCINVFSASYVSAVDMFGNGFYYLERYGIWAVVGVFCIFLIRKIGYRRLLSRRFLNIVYIAAVVLLILVDVFGATANGAQRWLRLGPLSLQPSEFAKLVVILLTARNFGMVIKKKRKVSLMRGTGLLVALQTLFFAFLVYKQPDMGTSAIIIGIMFMQCIIAGTSWLQIGGIIGLASAASALFIAIVPYRMERIRVWFNPWLDEVDSGYQMVQSLLAIGSGGISGTTWGQGTGKFFYLPEPHTDFAFAIFCQENGLIGALFLMVLFIVLGWAFLRIANNTGDERGFLLVTGASLLVMGQSVANMGMVCGLLPVIGVPLAFISYGGSSMLVTMTAIGLILSVYDDEEKQAGLAREETEELRRSRFRMVGGRRGL
ncbi:MAG: putative lipid II flippase FtsW [Phascolarctobacterium sp.]|nr:putative lipid II flippase FtsW [Phascolarctobacterium sp.]